MYSSDNAKAFKVSAKTRRAWNTMTENNDHAGLCAEQVAFILRGLEKIGSQYVGEAERLLGKIREICALRERKHGLNINEAEAAYCYYRMALVLVELEAGSTAIVALQ